MRKFLVWYILAIVFCGCAGGRIENSKDRFVNDRNYDVGRNIEWSYAMPAFEVSSHNQNQNKYIFERGDCKWIYYVNKNTKIVDSWEYLSSPDKCATGLNWFGIW